MLVWAYQVEIRDLKNTNNSIAIDIQLNVLAFLQIAQHHSIKLKFFFCIKMNFFYHALNIDRITVFCLSLAFIGPYGLLWPFMIFQGQNWSFYQMELM